MIVATVTVGTYPVPWLKYGLASIYNIVDKIVVVNSGYNFPFFTKNDVPLAEASRVIKEIDFNGKIDEIKSVYFKDYHQLLEEREGLRALGGTAAVLKAQEYNPDWILHFDSDQVFFANVKNISTLEGDGFQFLQILSYWLSPWHSIGQGDPRTFSDGTKFFKPKRGDQLPYFIGEGAPMIHSEHKPCDLVWSAHFRECYPAKKGEDPNYDQVFNYQFRRALFHQVDTNRLYKWGKSFEELVLTAFRHAKNAVYVKPESLGIIPAPVPPPEVVEIGPEKYVKEGYPQ